MIDCNVFLGAWPFRPLPATTASGLVRLLRKEGIARALVSPVEGMFHTDPQPANAALCAALRRQPSLLPVAVINPTLPNWREGLGRCQEMGAVGVKLHPNYHGYDLKGDAARQAIAAATGAGLPVILQMRVHDTRAQHPLMQAPDAPVGDVLAAAQQSPRARLVAGGIKWGEVTGRAGDILACPNLSVEVSQVEHWEGLRGLIRRGLMERLLFGSFAPFFYVRSAILKLEEAGLTPEEREAITRGNAERGFGMGPHPPP